MFVTADELATLTGLRRPSAQIRWLRSRHIRHYVNAVGHPVIARAWLIGDHDAVPLPQRPNLQALNRTA
jgi:hypothetical protein